MLGALFVLLRCASAVEELSREYEVQHIGSLDPESLSDDHVVVKVNVPNTAIKHRHKKYHTFHKITDGQGVLQSFPDRNYHTYNYQKWDPKGESSKRGDFKNYM